MEASSVITKVLGTERIKDSNKALFYNTSSFSNSLLLSIPSVDLLDEIVKVLKTTEEGKFIEIEKTNGSFHYINPPVGDLMRNIGFNTIIYFKEDRPIGFSRFKKVLCSSQIIYDGIQKSYTVNNIYITPNIDNSIEYNTKAVDLTTSSKFPSSSLDLASRGFLTIKKDEITSKQANFKTNIGTIKESNLSTKVGGTYLSGFVVKDDTIYNLALPREKEINEDIDLFTGFTVSYINGGLNYCLWNDTECRIVPIEGGPIFSCETQGIKRISGKYALTKNEKVVDVTTDSSFDLPEGYILNNGTLEKPSYTDTWIQKDEMRGFILQERIGTWNVFSVPSRNLLVYSTINKAIYFLDTEEIPIPINDHVLLHHSSSGWTFYSKEGITYSSELAGIPNLALSDEKVNDGIDDPFDFCLTRFGDFRRGIIPKTMENFRILGAYKGIIFYTDKEKRIKWL